MNDAEWGRLRAALVQQFDEDTVQQTLLALLEQRAKGTEVLNPLHWCRLRAASRMKNEFRRRDRERAMQETLTALKIPLDTRSTADLASARQRRHRAKAA